MVLFTKTEFYRFYCIKTACQLIYFPCLKTFLVGLKPPFGNILITSIQIVLFSAW